MFDEKVVVFAMMALNGVGLWLMERHGTALLGLCRGFLTSAVSDTDVMDS